MAKGSPVENFLSMIVAERGAAQNTVENYERDLLQFLDLIGEKELNEITSEDLSAYVQKLSQKHDYAPKSIARKISAVKEFFKFLFSEKEIKENPATYLTAPKQEKPLPKFLTEKELRSLIEAARAKQDVSYRRLAVMLEVMSACGLRVSELVSMPENCINFDKKEVLIRGKGSKERLIPISERAIEAVLDYLTYRDEFIRAGRRSIWLFPSMRSASGHVSRQKFFEYLKEIAPEVRLIRRGFHRTFCAILLRPDC